MAKENNYLLGKGEMLASTVEVPSGGGDKNPPYSFNEAKRRLSPRISAVATEVAKLPPEACPNDSAVAIVTLHPRYVSKSEFPDRLLRSANLEVVGSRLRSLKPESWGVDRKPSVAFGEDLFVAGKRSSFVRLAEELPFWTADDPGARALEQIEDIGPFLASDKIPEGGKDGRLFEVVLHNGKTEEIPRAFEAYARAIGLEPFPDRRRDIGGLTFFPVRGDASHLSNLATFSFVRVARAMPGLRPLQPTLTRAKVLASIELPEVDSADPSVRVAILDGGLPDSADLSRWVNLIDAPEIGPAEPDLQKHGLAVTSAFLFGSVDQGTARQPFCTVDHVRVLDTETEHSGDWLYLDVLDRIDSFLKESIADYEFINISVGPHLPCADDDVNQWTATLDQRLARSDTLATVAAGNAGEDDPESGLNRIQPPSDGVNVLSVGACTTEGAHWARASYSCVGPGRTPGIVKPDGLSFGGSAESPFYVLSETSPPRVSGTRGTSFAAPATLATCASVRVQLGEALSPLAIRALLIHRADSAGHQREDVGWGRLPSNHADLITCDDDEALIVYQVTCSPV